MEISRNWSTTYFVTFTVVVLVVCHLACRCVQHRNVYSIQRVYTDTLGLVEEDSSTILDRVGSNHFMWYPWAVSFF